MKKLLVVLYLLLVSFVTFSQKPVRQSVFYFTKTGIEVQGKDSADLIRVISEPDSGSKLYKVNEFYKNGHRKLIGFSHTVFPLTFEGTCITFYPNGKRANYSFYNKGVLDSAYEYYPNGKIHILKQYLSIKKVQADSLDYNFKIASVYDTSGKKIAEKGNGYFVDYDNQLKKVIEEGPIEHGLKTGQWKGEDSTVNITFIETYHLNKLVSGIATSPDGHKISYEKRIMPPHYPGGIDHFYTFIGRIITYPKYERERNIQGRVVVSFIVRKDGTTGDYGLKYGVSPGINSEVIRMVQLAGGWIPGLKFGKPADLELDIPVNFQLSSGQ